MEQVQANKEVLNGLKIANPQIINTWQARGIIDNQEFMLRLSISKRTAARWRITGKIPYIIIGKKTYYLVKDVDALLQGSYVRHRASKAFAKQIDDAAA